MKEPWGKCIIQYWLLKSTHKCKQGKHYYIFHYLWEENDLCISLLPGLHPWFNLHNLVRHMHDTNGDFSRLWVALALQEVIDPGLQETAQLCLRQPCVGGKQGSIFLFSFKSVQQLSKEQKEKCLSDNRRKSSNSQYRCPKWRLLGFQRQHTVPPNRIYINRWLMKQTILYIIYVTRMDDQNTIFQNNKRKIMLLIL